MKSCKAELLLRDTLTEKEGDEGEDICILCVSCHHGDICIVKK